MTLPQGNLLKGIDNKTAKSEFHTPLHKQIITLQKFNFPISIDISIKTHKFVCIRQN